MRQIDLSTYDVEVSRSDGSNGLVPYQVRESIVNLLFQPEMDLGGVELLKQDDLARKILSEPGDSILLEEAEYERVRKAVEAHTKYSRHDVVFVRRVLEAPTVKVKPIIP